MHWYILVHMCLVMDSVDKLDKLVEVNVVELVPYKNEKLSANAN